MGKIIELPITIPEIGKDRIIAQLSRKHEREPYLALREFASNALDAIDDAGMKDGKVVLALDPYARRLIVADNARGMSQEEMDRLSSNIGNSSKYGKLDKRGEKGVGLLDFGSLGDNLHLVSSQGAVNGTYHHVNWRREQVTGGEVIKAYRGEHLKTVKDLDEDFYGGFPRGTQAVIGLTEEVFKEKLSRDELINFLQGVYLPLIHRGTVSFSIAEVKKEGSKMRLLEERLIEAPKINGSVLIEERVPFVSTKAKKGSLPETYELDVLIAFGEDEKGKVSVHSKGVRVYEDITQMDKDFRRDPFWNCGFVRGFVNEPMLKLTLGRDAFLEQKVGETNAYKAMKGVLEEISKKYWPFVEDQINRLRVRKSDETLDAVFSLLEDAYQVGKPLNKKIRVTPKGDQNPPGGHGGNGGSRGGGGGSKDDGDDDDDNDDRKRRRSLPYAMRRHEFDLQEKDLRAKSAIANDGKRFIAINDAHPDYLSAVKSTEGEKTYLSKVALERIPECEILDAIRDGKKFSELEIPVKLIDRVEQLKFSLENVLKTPKGKKTLRRGITK